MRKLIITLGIFTFFFFIAATVTNAVQANEPSFSSDEDVDFALDQEDRALSYRFSGRDREEGIWSLFIKNDPVDLGDTPIAEQLNAIEPAAGIKFNMEF